MKSLIKQKKWVILALLLLLCTVLVVGLTLGRYTVEWKQGFGLVITPVEQEADPLLRKYFRSNELTAQGPSYEVNAYSTWFSVANALDSATYSQINVAYELRWFVSANGADWTPYRTESHSLAAGSYQVQRHTVAPISVDGAVYNWVKVEASTSSFLQEDISATYHFSYTYYSSQVTYAAGVIYLTLDTNNVGGQYVFSWAAGITPDNSDPTAIFAQAPMGPSTLTQTLDSGTTYEHMFFVTDASVLQQLEADPSAAATLVSVTKK